jgi:hypothetical protein
MPNAKRLFFQQNFLKFFANVKTINTFARTKKEGKTFFVACSEILNSIVEKQLNLVI